MKRFEYKTIVFNSSIGFLGMKPNFDDIEIRLNRLGYEGWEMVSVNTNSQMGIITELIYTLKREITS